MKKRKILVLFPLLGLFLTGCTFQEGLAATKSFIGDKIYHPLKDWFNGITGNKEEQKQEEKKDQSSDQSGQQDDQGGKTDGGGGQTDVVPVEKVTVKPKDSQYTVEVGATVQLIVTVEPENATDKVVTFSSGDETKATVDQTGLVTGKAAGQVTITVTSHENAEKTASVNLTIKTPDAVLPAQTSNGFEKLGSGELVDGEEVLFATVYGEDFYGMGPTETNFIAATKLEVENNNLVVADTFKYVVSVNQDGSYSFKDSNNKYLAAKSSGNNVTGVAEIDDYAKWELVAKDSGELVGVRCTNETLASGSRNLCFNYNSGNPRFSCYKDSTAANYPGIGFYHHASVPKVLDSISVEGPTTKDYYTGESLDLTGLVVTAHYLQGDVPSEEVITEGYEVSPQGPFTEEEQGKVITVSYQGQTATFTINVSTPVATLETVTISGEPKTAYEVGEEYSTEGLVVTAHYSDGEDRNVTNSCTIELNKTVAALADNDTDIEATTTYEGVASNTFLIHVTVTEPVEEKGTESNPFTPTELAEYAAGLGLAKDAYSENEVYVAGYVCTASGDDDYRSYNLGDNVAASSTFIVFGVKTGGVAYQNDYVVAKGFIKNHNGSTLELAGNSSHAYPSLTTLTRGTSNITVSSDHATVTVASTGTNLSNIAFTVAVDSGYEIKSVKANAEVLTESAGQYSFTLKGNTTILVDAAEIGAADPEVYKSVAFSSANAGSSVGSYTASCVYTDNGFSVTTQNFNNNNKGWEFIKCGRKGNASVATITTDAAIDKAILEIDIEFKNVTLPSGTTAKVSVSTDSSFATATDYAFTPVENDTVTVKLGSGVANAYYQIVFDCTSGGSNGLIWVVSASYKAIL